jgi:hypothetical protein
VKILGREISSAYPGSMKYQDIMTLESGNEKPCIRGMRITVYDVLSYHAFGMTSLSPEGAN